MRLLAWIWRSGAYDPYLSVDGALKRSALSARYRSWTFSQTAIITIHVPLNADTKNTISAEAIEKMKDGVRVINLYARQRLTPQGNGENTREASK